MHWIAGSPSLTRFEVAHSWAANGKKLDISAPKGPRQISPGQRPGAANAPSSVALKGHNKFPAFGSCAALSGLGPCFPHRTQGVALGWYVAAPLGRRKYATSKLTRRVTMSRRHPKRQLRQSTGLARIASSGVRSVFGEGSHRSVRQRPRNALLSSLLGRRACSPRQMQHIGMAFGQTFIPSGRYREPKAASHRRCLGC
jgi:hypothetical protein